MSYAVYSTKAWILGSSPSGEASKIYSFYTEEFGLIRAKAQGVRLLASKLRYNLNDYAFGQFSFIKGREYWRLTGAEEESHNHSIERKQLEARVLGLIKRLVQGEEQNTDLWQALLLLQDEKTSETIILSHILAALGYLDLEILKNQPEKEVIRAINKALQETQL